MVRADLVLRVAKQQKIFCDNIIIDDVSSIFNNYNTSPDPIARNNVYISDYLIKTITKSIINITI